MGRELVIGSNIIFVDPQRQEHLALVTQVWPGMGGSSDAAPGCNLVYVSGDASKTDPYGRQLERATSVTHKSRQPAPGNFWKWVDETD